MEDKFKDLLEDEELAALRLEALQSKRRKLENADNSSDSVSALPINSIISSAESASNQIPFVQSDRNAYNNYTWRKQIQLSRRRGGSFPKNSQRSNLIVISPVSLNDGKDSEEKVPALILPQHKWCNSGNEDSMSPKTLRRTGPIRFNRHGSDSESSDSDYENSENDSGSNETVLQDEPPEHFSRLSAENDAAGDNVEKQRRLSFQNLETEIQSEKSETTSVYNCLKNSSSSLDYVKSKSDNFAPVQNLSDNRHDWNSSVGNEYGSYKQYNSGHSYSTKPVDSVDGFVEKQNSCVMSNGESSHINETNDLIAQSSDTSVWQHRAVEVINSYYSRDISTLPENVRNHGLKDRKSKDFSNKTQSFQIGSEIQASESSLWQHGEDVRMNNSYFTRDATYSKSVPRNYNSDNVNSKEKLLSGNDLRLELKKRMQDMQSKTTALENCNEIIDLKTDQSNTWDRSKHRYTYEEDRICEVSCTNLYGSRQELNANMLRNRQERSFSRERDRDEHSVNLNRRRHHRSLSRERNKRESSFGRERNRSEYNFGSERSRYNRSSSQDRNKHEFSSSRGRSRIERSSSQGRNERSSSQGRNERSSSQGKSRLEYSSSRGKGKHERSSSRGRNRHECSSSRDRRHERSSSKSRMKYEGNVKNSKHERSPSHDRNKHDCRSSQERDKHENSVGRSRNHKEHDLNDDKCRSNRSRSRYERRYSPVRKRHAHSGSEDRSRHEYCSNCKHRSDHSSCEDSRHECSSSEDSRNEHSLSQDRNMLEYSSSQERNRHKRNQSQDRSRNKSRRSQDRNRHRKSSSQERNRHERSHSQKRSSQSQDSRSELTPNQDKSRQERSSSHDKNKHEYSSNQGSGDETRNRHEHNPDGTKNTHKGSFSQIKSKLVVVSGDEKSRLDCAPCQENIECSTSIQSRKLESVQNSERIEEDKRFEKTSSIEQSVIEEKNRQIRSRSKEKYKGNKRLSNTKYENYSRSRSSSTTSCSSSGSSSSSHSSRPKIRSVPSVVKSFQPKTLDADKKENFCDIKFAGKSTISTSHSDISSTSCRKDVIDCNKFSNVKCGRMEGESKASESNKRVPVHMRLGVLPRKRLIQMPKDVEAVFVNSSSSSSDGENINTKCKRQNIRIVTDVYGSKDGIDCEKKHSGKEKSAKRSPDNYQEKSKRVKTHR